MDKNILSESQKIRGTISSSDIEYYKLACLESISDSLEEIKNGAVCISDTLREINVSLKKISEKE